MAKRFVTFGHDHRHEINGHVIDHNCVAVVEGDRDTVFRIFGRKWCWEYPEKYWKPEKLRYYKGGYVHVSENKD